MNKKPKIKVIKKSELTKAQPPPIEEKSSGKISDREISSTVTDWVKEFQQRRYEENLLTFEQILANHAQMI